MLKSLTARPETLRVHQETSASLLKERSIVLLTSIKTAREKEVLPTEVQEGSQILSNDIEFARMARRLISKAA